MDSDREQRKVEDVLEGLLVQGIVDKFRKNFPGVDEDYVNIYASQAAEQTRAECGYELYEEQVRYGFDLARRNFLTERT